MGHLRDPQAGRSLKPQAEISMIQGLNHYTVLTDDLERTLQF